MISAERKPGEERLYREEKYAAVYEINMLRCIFCGYCEDACHTEAIILGPDYELSDYKRKSFIYTKEDLLVPPPGEKKVIHKASAEKILEHVGSRPESDTGRK